MPRRDPGVPWSTTPEGNLTTRSGPWRYTVLRCRSGWVWTREPVYERLTPEIRVDEAPSQQAAVRAVEDAIRRRA